MSQETAPILQGWKSFQWCRLHHPSLNCEFAMPHLRHYISHNALTYSVTLPNCVTGATNQVGGQLVHLLKSREIPSALLLREPKKWISLEDENCRVRRFDFEDSSSFVKGGYFLGPFHADRKVSGQPPPSFFLSNESRKFYFPLGNIFLCA